MLVLTLGSASKARVGARSVSLSPPAKMENFDSRNTFFPHLTRHLVLDHRKWIHFFRLNHFHMLWMSTEGKKRGIGARWNVSNVPLNIANTNYELVAWQPRRCYLIHINLFIATFFPHFCFSSSQLKCTCKLLKGWK